MKADLTSVKFISSFALFSIVFSVMVVFIGGLGTVYKNSGAIETNVSSNGDTCEKIKIMIDPGHGGEDGGASSSDGYLEKEANLAVSKKLEKLFVLFGYDIYMTREDDRQIYDMYNELEDYTGKKKVYDLKNRLRYTKETECDYFISIHMNKFSEEKYSGLQVYYSPENDGSMKFAEAIQRYSKMYLDKNNDRKIKKAGSNIYVMKKITIPAVLVECGFLSNTEEAKLLQTEDYQKKIAATIFTSFINLD